jgi:hypothetical protein
LLRSGLRVARARCDFHAGAIDVADARAVALEHAELLRQTGSELEAEVSLGFLGPLALVEGNEAFERALREKIERLDALGDRMYVASALGDWATGLCSVGQPDQALTVVARGRQIARPDDVADQINLDGAEGFACALLGDRERAELLMQRVRERTKGIDMPWLAERAEYVEASTRTALGDADDARSILQGLRESAERRGFVRFAEIYLRDLAALDSADRD